MANITFATQTERAEEKYRNIEFEPTLYLIIAYQFDYCGGASDTMAVSFMSWPIAHRKARESS